MPTSKSADFNFAQSTRRLIGLVKVSLVYHRTRVSLDKHIDYPGNDKVFACNPTGRTAFDSILGARAIHNAPRNSVIRCGAHYLPAIHYDGAYVKSAVARQQTGREKNNDHPDIIASHWIRHA